MIKVFEMFAGYGGAAFSLKIAGIPHTVVGFSEVDKYAIQCYLQNHGNVPNYGDATTINPPELPDFDLLTGGFPCQAFSVAGKGLGELDTRGTLFNDIIRIAEVKKPRWMLLENVKGLTTKKHRATFEKIKSELSRVGYFQVIQVLNSKKYGTPQNRERVFFACFREYSDFVNFKFPQEQPLTRFLKDILEPQVDESYYLSDERAHKLLATVKTRSYRNVLQEKEYSDACCARDYKTPKCVQVNNPTHSNDRVYSQEGVSNTLTSVEKDNYVVCHNLQPRSENRPSLLKAKVAGLPLPGGFGHLSRDDGVSYCVDRGAQLGVSEHDTRIRKLTPKECFRLMGFFQDQIKVDGLSKTQQYKLAGNGWDVNLVSQIFKEMFVEYVSTTKEVQNEQ